MTDSTRQRWGRRATSADVAREAGVSRTTVSFVLNDAPGQAISEDTRRRVREAADRLAYAPSAEARVLSRGRSDVVLLDLPSALRLTPDVGELIEQLAAQFAAAGLTLITHPWASTAAAGVWSAVSPAAVIAWSLDDREAEKLRANGVRILTSLTGSDPIGRWVTGPREDEIARLQVQTLTTAGHTRLAYARPDDDQMDSSAQLRLGALTRACQEQDLEIPDAGRVPLDPSRAAETVRSWRELDPPVTAVCAHDATTALAVLAGARTAGVDVPGDLAVVGVNDAAAAALADPPLTMVTLDAPASAAFIVEVVTALIAGRSNTDPGPSVAGLVQRGSI